MATLRTHWAAITISVEESCFLIVRMRACDQQQLVAPLLVNIKLLFLLHRRIDMHREFLGGIREEDGNCGEN